MTLFVSVSQQPWLSASAEAEATNRQQATAGAFTFGKWGEVTIRVDGDIACRLTARREELQAELQRLADLLKVPTPAELAAGSIATPKIENPTPKQTIEYFQQSPALSSMAGDVARALGPLCEQESDDVTTVLAVCARSEILDRHGNLLHGAQAKVASALKLTNAGGHRRRILAVIERLKEAA